MPVASAASLSSLLAAAKLQGQGVFVKSCLILWPCINVTGWWLYGGGRGAGIGLLFTAVVEYPGTHRPRGFAVVVSGGGSGAGVGLFWTR